MRGCGSIYVTVGGFKDRGAVMVAIEHDGVSCTVEMGEYEKVVLAPGLVLENRVSGGTEIKSGG